MDNTKLFRYEAIADADIPSVKATHEAVHALYEHLLTLPGGRERDQAVLRLEEVLFWATRKSVIS